MHEREIVSREQWLAARKALLEREKDFTHARDRLSEERRALPWVEVNKRYVFAGPAGEETLADLFDGRNQLNLFENFLKSGAFTDKTGKVSLYLTSKVFVFQFQSLTKAFNFFKSPCVCYSDGRLIGDGHAAVVVTIRRPARPSRSAPPRSRYALSRPSRPW